MIDTRESSLAGRVPPPRWAMAGVIGLLCFVLCILQRAERAGAGQHLAPPPSFAPGDQAFIIFAGAGFRLPLEEAARVFGDRNG
ncbi:MAG: hypothetical protein IT349_13840, partial [Candidatus Eisenbacteria bacterium]|nr:hypothetical protein [Candidatus Eisenbacteria bacterium]